MEKIQLIKGFLWIRYEVFDNQSLSAADILVYASLMRYMNNKTKECFPSLTILEKQSRLSRKTVYKSLDKLEDERFIHRTKENGKVNHYYILEPTSSKNSPSARGNEHLVLGEISTTNNTNINNTNNKLYADQREKEIIAYLNEKLDLKKPKGFKDTNQQTIKLLRARLKDYTKLDVLAVIDVMCEKWLDTEWQMFLRPQTLFNVNKFESYVNYIDVEGAESRKSGVMPLQELQ